MDDALEEHDQTQEVADGAASPEVVNIGEPVKAIGEEDGRYLRVGAYGLRFSNEQERDLTGEWFGADTDYGPHRGDGMAAAFHHCAPVGKEPTVKALSERIFRPVKATADAMGIFVEHVLDMADEYESVVAKLVQMGKLRWSSGTASHMIQKDAATGQIKRWHILEWSYTPQAAEPRLPTIAQLKSLTVDPEFEALLPSLVGNPTPPTAIEQPDDSGAGADQAEDELSTPPTIFTRSITMNLMEAIKQLVPGLTDEQYLQIGAVLNLAGAAEPAAPAVEVAEDAAAEEGMSMPDKEDPLRSVDIRKLSDAIRTVTNAGNRKAVTRPTYEFKPKGKDDDGEEVKAFNALYQLKYGEEDLAVKTVMADLVGKDYRQTIYDQNQAFAKYLRRGDQRLDGRERDLLERQIFPIQAIKSMLSEGMTVAGIKTTMIEAQGTLGGYAVPPNVQAEIVTRMPGFTTVRQNGARVITLNNSNSVEIPRYTGGDSQYVGNLRGQWGGETQSPTEQNATLDMLTVVAHVYTYKVPMSMSLVEDAANLVSLVQRDIAETAAIDEDNAFLTGDGNGKPRGILPAGSNADGLSEVNSGAAAALTADGLIALSDALDDQYTDGAIFIFRKATGTIIRQLKTGAGEYLFDRDLENNKRTVLGHEYRRSPAMPAVAANTYPVLYGQMGGYTIVERAGMTIVRFQDSYTGINKVEYQVRRRIGGHVERPWMLAVQKVSA